MATSRAYGGGGGCRRLAELETQAQGPASWSPPWHIVLKAICGDHDDCAKCRRAQISPARTGHARRRAELRKALCARARANAHAPNHHHGPSCRFGRRFRTAGRSRHIPRLARQGVALGTSTAAPGNWTQRGQLADRIGAEQSQPRELAALGHVASELGQHGSDEPTTTRARGGAKTPVGDGRRARGS